MSIRILALVGLLAAYPASFARADSRSDAMAQVEFGISVAQRGLWREAMYRWERAVEIDPSYAAAWNNLGIAYEHEGLFGQGQRRVRKSVGHATGQHADPAKLRPL